MAAPKLASSIGANGNAMKSEYGAGMLDEPGTKINGRMLGAAEKAPAVGSLGLNDGKKASETANGWNLIEPEIHLETCANGKEKSSNRGMTRKRFCLFRRADAAGPFWRQRE